MIFREATLADIPEIQRVRHTVKENVLSNPALVTDQDCINYITVRGKGWICEIDNQVAGFAIADLEGKSIWALFIDPLFEARGIGKKLHHIMLSWYFSQTQETVWLSTSPGTRAEIFYKKQGWSPAGNYGLKEVKFEMDFASFQDHECSFTKPY